MPTFEVIVGKKVIPITARTKKDALKRAVQRVCPKDDKGELEATPSNVLQSEKELSRDILPELEEASKDSGVNYTFTTLKACMFFLRYDAMPQLVMCSDEDFIDTIIDFSEYVVDKNDGKQSPAYSRSALAKNPEKRVAFLTYWNTYYLEYFDPEGLEARQDITKEDIEKKARVKAAKKEVRKTNRPDLPRLRTPSPEPTAKEIDRRREIRIEKERQEEFRKRLGEEEKRALEEVREQERLKIADERVEARGDLDSDDAVLLNRILGYLNVDGKPLIQKHKKYEVETRTSEVIDGRTINYKGGNYFETNMFAEDLIEMGAGVFGGAPEIRNRVNIDGRVLGQQPVFMPKKVREERQERQRVEAERQEEIERKDYRVSADRLLYSNKLARNELVAKLRTGVFQEEPLRRLLDVLDDEREIITKIRDERGKLPELTETGFIAGRLKPGIERPLTFEEGIDRFSEINLPQILDKFIEDEERERVKSPEPVAAAPVEEDRAFFEGMPSPSPAPRSPSPAPAPARAVRTPTITPPPEPTAGTPRKKIKLGKRKKKEEAVGATPKAAPAAGGRAYQPILNSGLPVPKGFQSREQKKREGVRQKAQESGELEKIETLDELSRDERKSPKKLEQIIRKVKRAYKGLYPLSYLISNNFRLQKQYMDLKDDSTLFKLYKNEYPNATFKNTLLGEIHLFALEQELFGAFDASIEKVSSNDQAMRNSQEGSALNRYDLYEENWGKEIADQYKASKAKLIEELDRIDITEAEQDAALEEFDRVRYNFRLTPEVKAKYNFRKVAGQFGDNLVSDFSEAVDRRLEEERQARENRPALERIVEKIEQVNRLQANLKELEKKKKKTKSQENKIISLGKDIRVIRKQIEDLNKEVEKERRAATAKEADKILKQRKTDAAKKS